MGQLFSLLAQYLFPNKEYKIVMVGLYLIQQHAFTFLVRAQTYYLSKFLAARG